MLKLLKIMIGAGSAGLATGIGTEIITNPAYSYAILDKVLGTGGKIILMLPLIGAVYISLKGEASAKKESTEKEKKIKGIKDVTWSMVLMLMDLFYASIVFIKENIKGIIVDEGWLKITKATTEKEKENYITEMVADYPTCSSLYKNINVNDYSTKLELLEELERRLKMPVENKGIFDSITLSETTTGYLKVGIVIIGILGVVYIVMNKNKVWDYIIHLGETVSELVQTEREFAKTAATLLKNDETFAGLIQRVQHEIIDLKATSLSEEVLKELQNAILLVSKNTEMLEKYAGRLNLLETDITETGKILEEILKVNSNT